MTMNLHDQNVWSDKGGVFSVAGVHRRKIHLRAGPTRRPTVGWGIRLS